MKQETIIYFAYGANLDLQGMQLRCPGCQPLGRGILPDHRLVFRGAADIEPIAGEQVYGALYEITPEHLNSLDRFESYPRLYNRKQVEITNENGETVTATVYQMTRRNSYSPPNAGYLGIILSGCRQWGIPEAYIRNIIKTANSHFGGL